MLLYRNSSHEKTRAESNNSIQVAYSAEISHSNSGRRVLATVGGAGRYRLVLQISARLLGSNWMRRPAQIFWKIELKFAEYICTNSIVFQASKVVVFAQCKFCMHYFGKDTPHHTAREQNYFLEKCSEPVHCDSFGRTAIRAPISELTPAQTLLGCAWH